MALDVLPDKLTVPTRSDIVARWERDVRLRNPSAQVGDGTLPTIDGKTFADGVLPIYAEAQRQAENATLDGKTGAALEQEAEDLGLPTRLPAAGASGFLIAETSVGGANIVAGQLAQKDGKRYQVLTTALYTNLQNVPVVGVDTGPDTNLDAGSVLQWVSPPAGLAPTAKVFENSDGTGLTGGRLEETNAELVKRIRQAKAEPAVAGNDAQYRSETLKTPGIGIQAAFTYPCIGGPGTTCIVFTVRPARSGATRVPNNAQIAAARAYVTGVFPKDDSAFWGTLLAQSVDLIVRVRWLQGVAGWTNASPWPPYAAGQPVTVQPGSSATVISVATAASPPTPQAGQTIALYDPAEFRFVPKRILSVSGANPWTLTIDPSNSVSDTAYLPTSGDVVMPWSDSLNSLVPAITGVFDTLGPGEQKASFFDDGFRERRSPTSPLEWPNVLSSSGLTTPITELRITEDVQIASPSLPLSTTVGTPKVQSRILELGKLSVFPL